MSIIAKSSWKPLPIPLDASTQGQLVCFEELTDYEVVSSSTEKKKVQTKKQKRQEQRLLDFQEKRRKLECEERSISRYEEKKTELTESGKKKPSPNSSGRNTGVSKKHKRKKSPKETNQSKIDDEHDNEHDNEKVVGNDSNNFDLCAWQALLVPEEILRALREMGFNTPTEIQEKVVLTAIQTKQDVVAAAETGSGKTLAFGIPLLHHMIDDRRRGMEEFLGEKEDDLEADEDEVDGDTDKHTWTENETGDVAKTLPALVLTPTRELAIQVKDHLKNAGKYTDFKMVTIVGGMSMQKQERLLGSAPDIIVATPGRLWEFIQQGHPYLTNLHRLRYLVIDEADRMLERGHFEELVKILDVINEKRWKNSKRQSYMFSATLTTVHSAPNRPKVKAKQVTKTIKLETLMRKIGIREKRLVVDLTTVKESSNLQYSFSETPYCFTFNRRREQLRIYMKQRSFAIPVRRTSTCIISSDPTLAEPWFSPTA